MRLRYTGQNQQSQAGDNKQEDRLRVRLRINGDYKVSDNFFAGFGLQTTSKNDSGNQTLADTTNGYHENYTPYISKAYVGWVPTPGVTLTGGKFSNPFYTTDLVWDADINPAGLTERIDFHNFLNLGGLELSLVAGQLSVSDNKEYNTNLASKDFARDGWVYMTQLVAAAEVASGVKVTVAPGFYCTNSGSLTSTKPGDGEINTLLAPKGLDGLKLVLAPGDVSFNVAGIKTKAVWDFSYNLAANKRLPAYAAYTGTTTPSDEDKYAYLGGFVLGENKKKGDWSLLANWRRVGLTAVDSSINDSDWALSRTNMQGYKGSYVYNLGDATTLGASYYRANNIRPTVNFGPADSNTVWVWQLDLVVKF